MKAEPFAPLNLPTVTADQRAALLEREANTASELSILTTSIERLEKRDNELFIALTTDQLQLTPERDPGAELRNALAAAAGEEPDTSGHKEKLGRELVSVRRQLATIRRALPCAQERARLARHEVGHLHAIERLEAYRQAAEKARQGLLLIEACYLEMEKLRGEVNQLGYHDHALQPVYIEWSPRKVLECGERMLDAVADKLRTIPNAVRGIVADAVKQQPPLAA